MNDKILSYLGLAMKSGNVVSGEFMTENAVKSGKSFLVILASDCSDNTKKKFRNMCEFYETPYIEYSDKDMLGKCIGKEFRASLSVNNEGFATSILKHLNNNNE